MSNTNSQVAQQYVLTQYPCLSDWITLTKKVVPIALSYDATSCAQLAMISSAAMKTFDYIAVNEPNSSVVRVSRMLNDLYDSAWKAWVSFTAQSTIATGARSISLTPTVLQGLSTFRNWDNALNPNQSAFSPPTLLDVILKGVTP